MMLFKSKKLFCIDIFRYCQRLYFKRSCFRVKVFESQLTKTPKTLLTFTKIFSEKSSFSDVLSKIGKTITQAHIFDIDEKEVLEEKRLKEEIRYAFDN